MLEVGAFLPVHWGIFALAMHAWDDPAATLLALAQQCDVQLVMPRLGEPVEPARTESVTPWWRAADTPQRKKMTPAEVPVESKKMELPQTMPRPID